MSGLIHFRAADAANNTPVSAAEPLPVELKAGTAVIGAVTVAKGATGTQASVSGSTSSVTLLAANGSRIGAAVFNDSGADLYLRLSASAASTTAFTAVLGGGDLYEIPSTYTGAVTGVWTAATGAARTTEF